MTQRKGNNQVLPADQIEKAAASRRAYQRQYRANHKDSVRRWNQTYWMRRAEREAATAEPGEHAED